MTRLFLRIFLVLFLTFALLAVILFDVLFDAIHTQFAATVPLFPENPVQLFATLPLWTKLVISGTTLFVIAFTALGLTVQFVWRLRKLEAAAASISKGDFSARAVLKSKTVMGSLGARFNLMADKIQCLLNNQKHLVHAVAHELRTPISRVRFGLEMMSLAKTKAERQRREQDIIEELEELDRLIEELVLFSRYDSGASKTQPVEMDLSVPVKKQMEKFRPLHPDTTIELVADPRTAYNAMADPRLVDKVIQNLLSNATRHAQKKVSINLKSEPDTVILAVSDDGPGIPQEDRQRVLEPFTRLDTSRNRQSGGFGLGLAIVNRILSVHRGKVTIGETNAGGAEIVTSWPRAYRFVTARS